MEKRESHTIFFYSVEEEEFVLSNRKNGKTVYKTASGKPLSRKEYFQSLPFMYFRNLVTDGTMPDSINGIKMDPHEINMTNLNVKLFPYNMDEPDYGLYPLFESNNGINSPTLPDDYFRFTTYGIEFIDSETNQLMGDKSNKYTKALLRKYFSFPPKIVAGNTSVRKSVDEGYFIVDAQDHLFNLKMTNGEPDVTVIRLPRGFYIKHIECVEVRSGEFLAIIIAQDNKINLLMSAGYFPQELPVSNYNPKTDLLRINGDMFHKTIVVSGPSYTNVTAINRDYEKVDSINETWTPLNKTKKGKWARAILPFQLSASKNSQGSKQLQLIGPYFVSFLGNLLFLLFFMVIQFKKKHKQPPNNITIIAEGIFILCFGLYAFIACTMLKPNKN